MKNWLRDLWNDPDTQDFLFAWFVLAPICLLILFAVLVYANMTAG